MLRNVFFLVIYHIKSWKSKPHILLGFFYLLFIGDMMFRPLRKVIDILGVRPTAYAFPLIWNSHFFLMMFFFGVILFYSDAPFTDKMTQFLMIRCGKLRFMAAQMIYVIFMGIMISAACFVIQALFLLPDGLRGWGQFWGTIAQTGVADEVGSRLSFEYHILWDFEPWEANITTFGLCILLTIMTGLVMYLFGLFHMKKIGVCILSVFMILPGVVDWLNFTTFYWLSPYSWICLDTTMREYNGSLPSLSYAFLMLCGINLCIFILIVWKTMKSKEILS